MRKQLAKPQPQRQQRPHKQSERRQQKQPQQQQQDRKPLSRKQQKQYSAYDVYEEDEEDEDTRKLIARRGGGGGALGRTMDDVGQVEYSVDHIDPEDDEDIDDEEAFDESDEEKYGMFFVSSEKTKQLKKKAKVEKLHSSGELDMNENADDQDDDEEGDDDDEEEELDGEYLDISELLNDDKSKSAESKKSTGTSSKDRRSSKAAASEALSFLLPNVSDDDDDGDDERADRGNQHVDLDIEMQELMDADDDDDDEEEEGDRDEDADESSLQKLSSFIHSMNVAKADDARKRKRLPEINEAFEESEFGLAPAEAGSTADGSHGRKRIGLQQLVGAIKDDAGFGGLKRQLETLGKLSEGQTVTAPLPARLQERLDREAAYEQAKSEVSKWTQIVKKNREADKLRFTSTAPKVAAFTSSSLIDKFKPTTDLEKEIQAMLEQTGIAERKAAQAEELELNKIEKKELQARRQELAQMRSLLFFKEQKQKKIAKIKSKTYRKLHKKAAENGEMSVEELAKLDPELAREQAQKLEMERAKERMTLKHKNTGKWAKQMLGKHNTDSESRFALAQQLERHEQLKRRIKGLDSDEDEEDVDKIINNEDQDDDENADARVSALRELDAIAADMQSQEAPQKGIFAMKFMQTALDRKKEEAKRSLEQARLDIEAGRLDPRDDYRDIDAEDDDGQDGDHAIGASNADGGDGADSGNAKLVGGNAGRMVFDGSSARGKQSALASFVDDEDDDEGEFKMDADVKGHSVRASGPVTIAYETKTVAKAPKVEQKPLFSVDSFDVENGADDDNAFVGDANKSKISAYRPAPVAVEASKSTQASKDKSESAQPSKAKKESAKSLGWSIEADGDKEAFISQQPTASHQKDDDDENDEDKDANPWLANDSGHAVKKSQSNVARREHGRNQQDRALAKMAAQKKQLRYQDNENLNTDSLINLEGLDDNDDTNEAANSSIQVESATNGGNNASSTTSKATKRRAPVMQESDADSDDEDGFAKPIIVSDPKTKKALGQRDLMRLAFANDDVEADFEAKKQHEIDEDHSAPIVQEVPGWGDWAGPGMDKINSKKNKAKAKAAEELAAKAAAEKEKAAKKRKDGNLKHVIISEKKIKKASKYLLPDLPHGFETREQYEKLISLPLGREWNTARTHSKMIQPRVQTRLGTVIDPIRMLPGIDDVYRPSKSKQSASSSDNKSKQ
eukprot:jgi/Hompol1/3459/HPOL_003240-RA